MMAGKLASFVGTVQLKLKVEKATSSEDEPAPSAFFILLLGSILV